MQSRSQQEESTSKIVSWGVARGKRSEKKSLLEIRYIWGIYLEGYWFVLCPRISRFKDSIRRMALKSLRIGWAVVRKDSCSSSSCRNQTQLVPLFKELAEVFHGLLTRRWLRWQVSICQAWSKYLGGPAGCDFRPLSLQPVKPDEIEVDPLDLQYQVSL